MLRQSLFKKTPDSTSTSTPTRARNPSFTAGFSLGCHYEHAVPWKSGLINNSSKAADSHKLHHEESYTGRVYLGRLMGECVRFWKCSWYFELDLGRGSGPLQGGLSAPSHPFHTEHACVQHKCRASVKWGLFPRVPFPLPLPDMFRSPFVLVHSSLLL